MTGRLIRADREPTFTEQARRKQIIGCAIEILAERGYSGASLAAIAERAGVSKGVISYHFAGKAELLEQVARAVYAAGAQYMQPRIQAEQTAAAMLAAYLRANLEFIRDHPQHMRAIAEIILNVRSGDGVLRLAGGREGIETVLDSVQSILRKGQQDGELGRRVRHPDDGVGGACRHRQRQPAARARRGSGLRRRDPRTDRTLRPGHQGWRHLTAQASSRVSVTRRRRSRWP